MPLYEYICPSCGKFEHLNTMVDRYSANCPSCGKPAQLVISSSYFRMAVPITLRLDDGTVLDRKPDGGRIAPGQKTSVKERGNLAEV